ncbi:MAG: electron transfer flavoprotein, alpha subunit [Firmicutes bacterium]|nr:electron transfer flavoprotein, alpha subunit [Bacillota bacterium]
MAGVYIYSDRMDLAAELVGFVKENQNSAQVLCFTQAEADQLTSIGADKVCYLQGDSPLVENYGQAIAEYLKQANAELFVVGATARGRDLAARVAGYLDCAMVSDASSLSLESGKLRAERMMYGGAVVQSEEITGLCVVTVAAGKYQPVTGSASVETVQVTADNRVKLLETAPIVKEGVDLRQACNVVCVGLGLEKEEDLKIARDLAAAIDAELGCTRGVAEERHWLPVEQYIGISGAIIKPQLYISMGVSGQVQHVFGVRDAKVIVAIDSNEKAPIFRSADFGIVGDMYEIVPLLTQAIKG